MSLAAHPAVLWLDDAEDRPGVRNIAGEIEALSGLVAELDARLGQAGIGGLAGAVDAYRRIKSVLDGVTLADLERISRRLESFRGALAEVERGLAAVRELKAVLGRTDEPR